MTEGMKFKKPDMNANGFNRNEYETPVSLFNTLDAEFNFTCDLAASAHNSKCANYIDEQHNSLIDDWHKRYGWLWLNPPFSPLRPWIEKAQNEADRGAKVIMLVPTTCLATTYFAKRLPVGIRIIYGRVNFWHRGREYKGNTQDLCLLVFDGGFQRVTSVEWIPRASLIGS